MNKRVPDAREYCHDRLGDKFDEALSQYDTARRLETLVDDFLTDEMLVGKRVLDVGCGLGFFSQRLKDRGGVVTACDLGPNLVARTRERVGCEAVVADALRLGEQFGEGAFDLVVSSECIEHTPDPGEALRQMARVAKPGGYVAVSTPNVVWLPVVKLATAMKVRPFDGIEKFSTWGSMAEALGTNGVRVLRRRGLHLFPFQFGMHGVSRWCDRHMQGMSGLMINLCVLGQKERR